MSEEAKNTVPETEQPETAPEEKTAAAAPEQAAAEAATEEDKKKDGGWFNKKARELEAVKAKLDAAEKNAAQAKDQLLRMAAEYDNYRKRSTREADQKFGDGVSHAVEKIIPILDTLDMAANAPTTDENYKKGVVMTLDKAAKALEALHVEEIEVLGKPFDPNFMNAVQQIPAPDGQESGTVVTVYQKGYKQAEHQENYGNGAGVAVFEIVETFCIKLSCKDFCSVVRTTLSHIVNQVEELQGTDTVQGK